VLSQINFTKLNHCFVRRVGVQLQYWKVFICFHCNFKRWCCPFVPGSWKRG